MCFFIISFHSACVVFHFLLAITAGHHDAVDVIQNGARHVASLSGVEHKFVGGFVVAAPDDQRELSAAAAPAAP